MIRLQVLGALGLVGDDGREIRPLLAQPKRLALLVYLALAEPRGFHRRDRLVALFWPDAGGEPARAALRRALHFLRTHLGEGVIASRGEEEVGVAPDRLWCDGLEFERHLAAGREVEALAEYRGDLLTGFFVSEAAPELDQWLDGLRRRYRESAYGAAERASARDEAAGNPSTALFWARRAVQLAPLSEPAVLRVLRLLGRAADRATALQTYEDFARRLQAELGVEPGPELRTAVQELRARRPTPASTAAGPLQPPSESDGPQRGAGNASLPITQGPPPSGAPLTTSRRRLVAGAGALALVGLAAVTWVALQDRSAEPQVLAVGAVVAAGGGDTADAATVLPGLMATGLGDLEDVQVISRGRLYELSGELGGRGPSAAALMSAAKRAGANRLVEGEVFPQPDGWRLDLRLVDLRRGTVRRSYVLRARDLFELSDSATARLAEALRRERPAARPAELGRASLVAHRYFDDGLRAYYRRDFPTADALFGLALSQDSAFALALYYAARTRGELGAQSDVPVLARRALAAAQRGTRYERLLIGGFWALLEQTPEAVVAADSLVQAYPLEPEGYTLAGGAHWFVADYPGQLRLYRRLAALDSSAQQGGPVCRICQALDGMASAYASMDSLEQALAEARTLRRLQPRSQVAWANEVAMLSSLGRFDEAHQILEARADSVGATVIDVAEHRVVLALERGDFVESGRGVAALKALTGPPRIDGLWYEVLDDRVRGRLAAALAAARQYEAEALRDPMVVYLGSAPILRAVTLFESGRPREAAALFDTLRLRWRLSDSSSGQDARQHAWMLAHEVTALAAAGDTSRLALLADTLEQVGRRSGYARDRRMHHYARGLLWDARHRPAEAVAEFRQALTSPTYGYTRINYRLAADLLALGRVQEAIPLLRAAFHGGLEANNLYITHTELHDLLAKAFDAAGVSDSAAAHYRWVASAWRGADVPYFMRGRGAAARAAALGLR